MRLLNDDEEIHKIMIKNLLQKLRERNWHPNLIRRCQRKNKLQYKFRSNYIKSVQKQFINKTKINVYNHIMKCQFPWTLIEQSKYNQIEEQLINTKDNEIKKIYFKKTFNRFMDYDSHLRKMLHQLIENLGLNEKIKIQICNKINIKLGRRMLY